MPAPSGPFVGRSCLAAALAAVLLSPGPGTAGQFSISPVRADLKPGVMSETITVTNDGAIRLRLQVKLFTWTQDANGADVYEDSNDLVYFPRQMDIEAGGKRLVRVGARSPGAAVERSYRLFIEEIPDAAGPGGAAAVNFYFRFGVPVFLLPAVPKPEPEIGQAVLDKGKVALPVANLGNAHFRTTRITLTDGATFSQDLPGWYSLAGTRRVYNAEVPAAVCRGARQLTIKGEGDNVRFERAVDVDPGRCG